MFMIFQLLLLFIHNINSESISYKVLLLGDWGISKDSSNIKNRLVETLKNKQKESPYQLALELGDNFYENGITEKSKQRLVKEFDEEFTLDPFDIPFLIALGNHDYHGDISLQIAYSKENKRWHMPNRYFSYEVTVSDGFNIKFIVLDSETFEYSYFFTMIGARDNVQLKWFEKELESSSSYKYVFVVAHHPTLSGGPHSASSYLIRTTIRSMCNKFKITAYLSGHNHNLQHFLPKNGVTTYHSVTSGAASKTKSGPSGGADFFHASSGGYSDMILNLDGGVIRYFSDDGTMLYSVPISPRN